MPQPSSDEGPSVDDIMAPGDIKATLAVARRGRPINCAVALTTDKEGVILLDRKIKPKRLAASLRKQCAATGLALQLTSVRFGRASVDTKDDAALVMITINKDPPAIMRPRLLKRLKKIGFHDIDLHVDAELEEADEDEEEEEDETGDDREGQAGEEPGEPPPASNKESESRPAPDTRAPAPANRRETIRALAALLRQMRTILPKIPNEKTALIELAKTARDAVKSDDAGAPTSIAALRAALTSALKQASHAVDPGAQAKLEPASSDAPQDGRGPSL